MLRLAPHQPARVADLQDDKFTEHKLHDVELNDFISFIDAIPAPSTTKNVTGQQEIQNSHPGLYTTNTSGKRWQATLTSSGRRQSPACIRNALQGKRRPARTGATDARDWIMPPSTAPIPAGSDHGTQREEGLVTHQRWPKRSSAVAAMHKIQLLSR